MKKNVMYGTMAVISAGLLLATWSCAPYKYHTSQSATQKPTVASASSTRPVQPTLVPVVRQPAEVRAVWVSDTTKFDWNTATINLQRTGFNTMYVNMASAGAAFYPASKQMPSLIATTRQDLASNIELAHRRGLHVHAKLIVLFMFKSPLAHQQKLAAANRVMRMPNGNPVIQNGNMWLCPSNADNRKLILDTVTEMLSLYRFDGVQYDYIRLSEEPSCYCSTCKREFERATGWQLANWPATVNGGQHTLRYRQWRQDLINDWVRTLTAVSRQTNPHIMVSAAVFSDLDRAREEKSQDWQLWLQRGYVDYVCTMTYTTKPAEFEGLIQKQKGWVQKTNQLVVGVGSWKMHEMNELNAQIGVVRRQGTAGFALFSYDDMEARAFYPMVSIR
jgi:uncharacterized lipoprotein YddW (UPF0748 family)